MPAILPDRLICPMLHGFNRSLNRVKNQNPSHAPAPGQACMGRWLSSLMTHTACSPGVGSRCWPKLSAGRSEGSSPSDAKDRALHTCIRQVRVDLDHDAVMRIGGKAPRRQAHSLRWRTSHACLGSPPPRIVIGAAVRATRRRNRLLAICFPAGCSRRCTQDDTPRASPVVTSCHNATSSLRASATIMVLRVAPRASAVRARYHWARGECLEICVRGAAPHCFEPSAR